MSTAPDRRIQEAFLEGVSRLTQRVELYESDGETPWRDDLWPRILSGGNVAVDGSRDERRSVDVELDNYSGELDPQVNGLWYDKVLKVYLGIILDEKQRSPKIAIVEEFSSIGQGLALRRLLSAAGHKVVFYNPQMDTQEEAEEFDILISISATRTQKLGFLTSAFARGKSIITFGLDATQAQLPYIIGGAASSVSTGSGVRTFEKEDLTEQFMNGWNASWTLNPPHSYRKILSVPSGAHVLAYTKDDTNGFSPAIVLRRELGGAGWLHVMQNQFDPEDFDSDSVSFSGFLSAMIGVLDYYVPLPSWECQVGEFLADSIEDVDEDGYQIRFTGRDYTKRMLSSKLTKSTTFQTGEKIEDIIKTLGLNSGIRKFDLPRTGISLGKPMTWERDKDRWSIAKEIALANNYELFFSATGFLTLRPQQDPLLTPPSLVLSTGHGGNLVTRGARTGDGELYNQVTVVGESSDSTVPLVYGEAVNDNPISPSSVQRIGYRTLNISSPIVTTDAQALALAQQRLSVSALQEFELNFTAVAFPWVDVGEIVEMADEEGTYWGPTRFLLTSLGYPFDLGPMTGSAKRVTRVS